MRPFEYLEPPTLAEALGMLSRAGDGRTRLPAGGTDLLPRLKRRQ